MSKKVDTPEIVSESKEVDLPEIVLEHKEVDIPASKNPHEEVMGRYYATIAKRDVVFARSAYAGFAEKKGDSDREEFKKVAELLPANYQLLLASDYLTDTKKHQYRAMVFVNNDTKEVIVASSGTRFGRHKAGKSDLFNDAYLMMSKTPPKMRSIEVMNEMILQNLGSAASEYKIHYTGHSLGASLSDLAAADMAIKYRQRGIGLEVEKEPKISTMTFENPGSKKIIEQMYKKAGYDPALYSSDVDYKGINNKRNLINQATTPAGKMWEIEPDGQNNKMNGMQRWAFYRARKLHRILPFLGRVLETFAMGGISKQMKTHSLEHFDDVICHEKGKVKEMEEMPERSKWLLSELLTGCKKVICNAFTAKKLAKMKKTNGDIGVQKFVVVTADSKLVTASEIEAQAAVSADVGEKQSTSRVPYIPDRTAMTREELYRKKLETLDHLGKRSGDLNPRLKSRTSFTRRHPSSVGAEAAVARKSQESALPSLEKMFATGMSKSGD